MCYWFQFEPKKDFFQRFEIDNRDFKLQSKYDNFPGKLVPVITRNSVFLGAGKVALRSNDEKGGNKVELMRWGLIPFWAKDPKEGNKLANARSETVNIKPSFKRAVKNRCIIPVTGFYEWKEVDGKKKPHFFHLEDGQMFGIAGIYDEWKDVEGRKIKCFSMLTKKANKDVAPIHDRMPVILKKDEEDNWFETVINKINELSLKEKESKLLYTINN